MRIVDPDVVEIFRFPIRLERGRYLARRTCSSTTGTHVMRSVQIDRSVDVERRGNEKLHRRIALHTCLVRRPSHPLDEILHGLQRTNGKHKSKAEQQNNVVVVVARLIGQSLSISTEPKLAANARSDFARATKQALCQHKSLYLTRLSEAKPMSLLL